MWLPPSPTFHSKAAVIRSPRRRGSLLKEQSAERTGAPLAGAFNGVEVPFVGNALQVCEPPFIEADARAGN
jgi:hypothetical protein